MQNIESCQKYAKDNIVLCAREVLLWHSTGRLAEGKVRELALMVSEWAPSEKSLSLAESFITTAALEMVANYWNSP